MIKKYIVAIAFAGSLFLSGSAFAATPPQPVLRVKAAGAAIYGWHDGEPTLLYQKKLNWLFPVASITKLATAKAVEQLFDANKTFTVSASAIKTVGSTRGITVGAVYSRDDLLRALLISSSNDAATLFAEYAKKPGIVAAMNTFLHDNHYTATNFVNPSGLDPADATIRPNRMTPLGISHLISDIYARDDLLRSIMMQKSAIITDQATGTQTEIKSSDELNYDPLYADRVIIGKTGRTDKAAETLTFVTDGYGEYDYITVVLLYTGYRYNDGKAVLDWIEKLRTINQ
jgi:D-alanyl-D-alanine carboxypeptidase